MLWVPETEAKHNAIELYSLILVTLSYRWEKLRKVSVIFEVSSKNLSWRKYPSSTSRLLTYFYLELVVRIARVFRQSILLSVSEGTLAEMFISLIFLYWNIIFIFFYNLLIFYEGGVIKYISMCKMYQR